MTSNNLFELHKLKNLLFNGCYYLLNVLFPLLTYPHVARVLGVDNIGLGNLAISLGTYFATIASLGIPIYGIREVAKCREDKAKLSFLVSELIIINTIGVLISVVIYTALILYVDIFRENLYIYILAGLNLLFSFFQIDWLFQGVEKFKTLMVRNFIVKLVSLIMVYNLISQPNDVNEYVFISVLGLSLANVINILESRKFVKLTLSNVDIKRHIKSIMFFSSTRLVSTVYTVLDSVILGLLTNNYFVGLYSTAVRLVRVVVAIISSVTMVFFADTARQGSDDNEKVNLNRLTDLFVFIFSICTPIAGFLVIFADVIVLSFAGADFVDAGETLKILSLLVMISIGTNFLGMQVLYARNLEKYVLQSLIVGAIICIVLNLILTSTYKHNGAAYSTVLAETGILLYQIIIIKTRKLPVFSNLLSKMKKAIIAIMLYFLSIIIIHNSLIIENEFKFLFFISGYSLVSYPLILFLVREPIFMKIIENIKK
ncbi:flippase [Vibrio splendidus]|uniref:flippase n=1 Tax=Vibrio splendidus TaxID=29497 RepID=UPI000E09715F|nr:flippase [Vibrio splendidus]